MTKQKTKRDNQNKILFNFGNQVIILVLKTISLFPLKVVYVLSDFLFVLNKNILKYRYQVSFENLKCAFPEKSKDEILVIRDKFYRHFFDFTLESVKLFNMSEKEMNERIVFKGLEESEKITGERMGAIVLAFHYNNWEWCSFVQTKFKYPILMVYNPPRNNKPMENFLKQARGKWGGKVISTDSAARATFDYKRKGEPVVLWLAADQRALATSPWWINFLNREAAFFAGPGRLAKKTNHPIFFQEVKKVARGKYEVTLSKLIDEPAKLEANEILRRYVLKMEEVIKSDPEYYLWSHKRWKHKRPENIELIN